MPPPHAFKPSADHLISNNVIPVVSCADDGSAGTLRDAFTHAIDGDTLDLTGLACSTISLTTGALADSPAALNVKLLGAGQTIDGGDKDRVISHLGSGNLTIQQLTITHGHHTNAGGCVYSAGGVTLRGSTVSSCHVVPTNETDDARGGAVFAKGGVDVYDTSAVRDSSVTSIFGKVEGGGVWALHHVRVKSSSISGNSAITSQVGYSSGGGVFAYEPDSNLLGFTVAITGSTISHNYADEGGGVFADHVSLLYSTVSDNNATFDGGGIFAKKTSTFTNLCLNGTISGNSGGRHGGGINIQAGNALVMSSCTVTNNHAPEGGGGIFSMGTLAEFHSVIIAGNDSSRAPDGSDLSGTLTTQIAAGGGRNLIVASTIPVPADTINSPPLLGPLQANGGLTFTHALLPGSPAIDHGGSNNAAYDQRGRGYPRVVGSNADIGAFEFNDHPIPAVTCVLPPQIYLAGTTSADGTTDLVDLDLSKLFSPPVGNSLSYSASGLPMPPLAIDATTGILTGTLQSDNVGTDTATLTATASPAGTSATQMVRVEVLNAQNHIFRHAFETPSQPCQ